MHGHSVTFGDLRRLRISPLRRKEINDEYAIQVPIWMLNKKEAHSDGRCLEFRYYETTQEGRRCRRSKFIGTLAQYPTRADALPVVERFRLRLNLQQRFGRPTTLDALIDHYIEKKLLHLRYGTQQGYLSCLNHRIRPRWGTCLLHEIKPWKWRSGFAL